MSAKKPTKNKHWRKERERFSKTWAARKQRSSGYCSSNKKA